MALCKERCNRRNSSCLLHPSPDLEGFDSFLSLYLDWDLLEPKGVKHLTPIEIGHLILTIMLL